MTEYGGGAGSSRFGGSSDDDTDGSDSSDGSGGTDRSDVRGGGGGGGTTPSGSRSTSGGSSSTTRTETVRASSDVSAGVGAPGGVDRPSVSGTSAVENIGRDGLGGSPETGIVDLEFDTRTAARTARRQRFEADDPGTTARTVDRATDFIENTRPAAAGAVNVAATSLRSDNGVPIPGTDRRLPGGDDVDAASERFSGSADRIDAGIERGIEAATLAPDDGPTVPLSDVPLRSPGETAAIAAVGTEAGRRGVRAGVTTGAQALNPAAAAEAAPTAAEATIRGVDRAVQADADETQTALDVGEAAGETAVDVGPAAAGAAVADDPARAFEAPAAGFTTVVGGAALGSGAARGARTASRLSPDSDTVRRFVSDERGQLGSGRRVGEDDDSVEIDPDDIADSFDEPDQRSIRPELEQESDIDAGSTLDRRRGSRIQREADDGRGDSMIDPTSPGDVSRRFDDVEVPRDPLDTRGGRQPSGGSLVDDLSGAESGVGVGAGLTGLGGDALGGQSDTAIESDLMNEATGATVDAEVGVGPDDETVPTGDTGTGGTGQRTGGLNQAAFVRLRADTAVRGQEVTDSDAREIEASGSDPLRRPFRPARGPRPRRIPPTPDVDLDFEDSDGRRVGVGIDDAQFENPTQSLTEVDEDLVEDLGGGG